MSIHINLVFDPDRVIADSMQEVAQAVVRTVAAEYRCDERLVEYTIRSAQTVKPQYGVAVLVQPVGQYRSRWRTKSKVRRAVLDNVRLRGIYAANVSVVLQ